MTTHDDLLHAAALAQAEHPGELEYLFAEKMLAAAEPIIRADERARVLGALDGPARESEAMYAHAESIAARLVEVICEDAESEAWIEDSNQQLQEQITGLIQTGYALRRDLKQALAELAEVRERIAQEIEAFHAAECGPPESPWPHVCTCATAAAIARGEQS